MSRRPRIAVADAFRLLVSHAWQKIRQQAKVVIPLVLYLLFFQTAVLGLPFTNSAFVVASVGLVVLGLAFFLEGIRLSIMPLGEAVGLRLPVKAGLTLSLIFGLLLGVGATLAEPAISVLHLLGSTLNAWDAPLAFVLLNNYSTHLIISVGLGVGAAVVLSLLRLYLNWSLKPLLLAVVPPVLGLTVWSFFDPNLRSVTGLAWDTGGVTTGPVTVPLVVALGIGVSRAYNRDEGATSGLGLVTLASLLPIIAVFVLALGLQSSVPYPMGRVEFFAAENRSRVIAMFESEEAFRQYARRHGVYVAAGEGEVQPKAPAETPETETPMVAAQVTRAARSILPLSLVLVFFVLVLLRKSIQHWDEVFLGVFLALVGMVALNAGIEQGLARLGGDVGRRLPAAFKAITVDEARETIPNFDLDVVQTALTVQGEERRFFYLDHHGKHRVVPFDPERYDSRTGIYEHVARLGPLFVRPFAGVVLVLFFALLTGYGATMAEPALAVLGDVVEEITAGAFRRSWLIRLVGLGVGLGMVAGVVRVLWGIPMLWMIAGPYLVLLILTIASSEDFVNIAWDCAGVTTGPVTVPLIIAMGMGLGGELGAVEGFGIISLASAYPIVTVLSAGLFVRRRQRYALKEHP